MIIFKGYKRKQGQGLDLAFLHHIGKKNFFHQDIEQKDTKRPASYSLLFIAFIFVVNCISIYESLFLELFERFRSVTEKQTPSLNIKVFFFFLLLKVAHMQSIYTWYYIFKRVTANAWRALTNCCVVVMILIWF